MRIEGTDVRQMPLHIQEQVGIAIVAQMGQAASVAGREGENMTLQKAIKLLELEYEKARKLDWVHNPLAFALYRVWKKANGEETNDEL